MEPSVVLLWSHQWYCFGAISGSGVMLKLAASHIFPGTILGIQTPAFCNSCILLNVYTIAITTQLFECFKHSNYKLTNYNFFIFG